MRLADPRYTRQTHVASTDRCSGPTKAHSASPRITGILGVTEAQGQPQAAAATMAPVAAVNEMPSDAARKTLFGVGTEQASEIEVKVMGELPSWLNGSLIVNGGGDYSRMNHMFDGYALVSKVRVSGGQAWGSQRFLQSKSFNAYKTEGRVVLREFGTRPEVSGWWGEAKELMFQLKGLITQNPEFTDNASVSLQQLTQRGGRTGSKLLLAMSETPTASYLVDPETLDTVEQVTFTDGVPGELTTAHPSILSDGTFLNFTRTLPFGGFHIFKQDPLTLRRTEVAFVPDRRPLSPAWLHDFAATDKYAVILEHPLYMSLASLLLGTAASHLFMNWMPQDEVKISVVALDGSKVVRTFTCPAFFYFHVGNAYESQDGSCLHIDLAAYDDPQILHDLSLQPLTSPMIGPGGELKQQVSKSYYKRLTIPLTGPDGGRLEAMQFLLPSQAAAVQQQEELGLFCEFPSINTAYRYRPYQYVYCLSAVRPTNQGNALSKLDLRQGTSQTWHSTGGAVGEPVFVPRPGSSSNAEDDGVVLAPGVDAEGKGFMLVMNAATWTELARVELPYGVPNRFHGTWMDGL